MSTRRHTRPRPRPTGFTAGASRFGAAFWWTVVIVLALFWATTDDREAGLVADGRQMVFTAVALTESGSLGQARGRDLTVPRAQGDSVSRYGLAPSVAQVPAAWLAPRVEAHLGAGTSQPLFLVAPFVFVMASAVVAAAAARALGGAAVTALLLATIASPLGAYVALELSEPLQALSLAAVFLGMLRAADPATPRWRSWSVLAGMAFGTALLTKSSLIAVAPFAMLPVISAERDRRRRALAWWASGLLPVAAVWLYFEVARFGRPFAGYAGEGFTHPFLDGAWRLLVGVNKGMIWYYPATILAIAAPVVWWRRDRSTAWALAAAVAPFGALLLLAAPWWAWHGVDGWGPRLLVPAVPLLAIAAAVVLAGWPSAARIAFVAVCIALNLPPLLQHPTPAVRYEWANAWPSDATELSRVPRFARRIVDGTPRVPPDQVLATVPSASPFILLPWFWSASGAGGSLVAARFNAPPWSAARPDIRPSPPLSENDAVALSRPHEWRFWGRGFDSSAARPFAVYDAALADQILRAQQLGERERALDLALKLDRLAPSGFADALTLESYRLLRRKPDAVQYLAALPIDRRRHPAINVVLALWDRDDGKEQEARALLRSSADNYVGFPVERALSAPLSEWPATFAAMTADPSLQVDLEGQ